MATDTTTYDTHLSSGTTISWGTDADTTYGLVQSINHSSGAQTREYKDFCGDTKALVVYDKHEQVSMTAICPAATNPPEIGSLVTIKTPENSTGIKIRVTSASVDYANEDAAKISISGRTYPSLPAS